jgi:cytochrome c peroxidase
MGATAWFEYRQPSTRLVYDCARNMTKTIKRSLSAIGILAIMGLAVPLMNLAAKRPAITVSGGPPTLAPLSLVLQHKCVDCHSPALAVMPFYTRMPVVKMLIQKDQRDGVAAWKLSREELSGQRTFSEAQQAKLEWVATSGEMPPLQYLVMHWTSSLSAGDRATVSEYIAAIRRAKPEAEQMAEAHRSEPIQILLPPGGLHSDKVELGRRLFHDPQLSGDGKVACSTCHPLNKGGTDQLAVSTGIRGQKGGINDPSVFNSSYNVLQFWDGRAADLQAQAGGPVENPIEMGATFPAVVEKLRGATDYAEPFAKVYPSEGITKGTITDAIAEFERSLVTVDAPFDKYLRGDERAISDGAKRGYSVFKSAGCAMCHYGPAVGGRSFERFGVFRDYFAERGNVKEEDNGRFNFTHQESDRHLFKVPILRNVTVTFPYFHDASARELRQAVSVMARYQLEDAPGEADIGSIVTFLESLTGTYQGKSVDKL